MVAIFPDDKQEILARKVRMVLAQTGYFVHHDGLVALLRKKGLHETLAGRFVFDNKIIDEFVELQEKRQRSKCPPPPPDRPDKRPEFKYSFGHYIPKYYDYPTGTPQLGCREHLEKLVKFAHQDNLIGKLGMPIVLSDIPAATEPLETFLMTMKMTNKFGGSFEAYSPELIKYMVELSDIFRGPGKQDSFIDNGNCINPILRLEERVAAMLMERPKHKLSYRMISMPTAGGNAPVSFDGSVIQGTAEIVGGLIICWLINSETTYDGYISSSVLDLKTVTTTQGAPETVLIDCGVVELMDHCFGGNTTIGGRCFVSATRPGLQAVFEKMFKALAYQKYTGKLGYGGAGILDNGCLVSPEQIIIDLDVARALFHLRGIDIRGDAVEEAIAEVVAEGKGDFLSHNHTLDNYVNAFWEPLLFQRGGTLSEEQILAKAHTRFEAKVASYQGYEYDEDKVKAGEVILARAKKELL